MHAAICDFLLDLVQNSLEAGASLVELSLEEDDRYLSVKLTDNGCGMSSEELERVKDPFYTDGRKHHHRKVGLGIPFLLQMVEQTGGSIRIDSQKGKGTLVSFSLPVEHVDLPPMGSIPAFLLPALTWKGEYEMVFERRYRIGDTVHHYCIRKSELLEILGELESADSLILLRSFLINQEEELVTGDEKPAAIS
jgi:hypothetical protein